DAGKEYPGGGGVRGADRGRWTGSLANPSGAGSRPARQRRRDAADGRVHPDRDGPGLPAVRRPAGGPGDRSGDGRGQGAWSASRSQRLLAQQRVRPEEPAQNHRPAAGIGGGMIRVLVAEDSPTTRALLVAILTSDPEVQVVGEARDGKEAVALTKKLRPDVVTMDVQMPRMNGFEATKEIMITAPTPIVIVTASLLARDVEATMHALRNGALAVLAKPGGPESPNFEEVCRELIA